MSAATYTEAMIVAARRNLSEDMEDLLTATISDVVALTPERARLAGHVYTLWGKNFHAAALNYGDCFAYATAKEFDCPLLFVGNDFARTDVKRAIPAASP